MQEDNTQNFDIKNSLYDEVNAILKFQQRIGKIDSTVSLSNDLEKLLNSRDLESIERKSVLIRMLFHSMITRNDPDKFYDTYISILRDLNILESQGMQNTKGYKELQTRLTLMEKRFNEIKNGVSEIRDTYKEKLEEITPLLTTYRRTIGKIKYGDNIDEKEIKVIEYIMNKYGVPLEEQEKLKEELMASNEKVIQKEDGISHAIGEMLSDECTKIQIDDELVVKYGDTLKNNVVSTYSSVKKDDKNYMDFLKEIKNSYTKEEFTYILANVINMLIDERASIIEDMKEVYDDEELRNITIASYGEVKNKMADVFYLYHDMRFEEEKVDEYIVEEKEEIQDNQIKNNIYFAFNKEGEAYVEKDLKYIRKEKLEEFAELIKKKKYGKLNRGEDQALINHKNLKHFRKLKGDQVRIVYRDLVGNNILIIGVFIKKDTIDMINYNTIAKRVSESDIKWYSLNIENIKTTSDEAYERIASYVSTHKRMGTR